MNVLDRIEKEKRIGIYFITIVHILMIIQAINERFLNYSFTNLIVQERLKIVFEFFFGNPAYRPCLDLQQG